MPIVLSLQGQMNCFFYEKKINNYNGTVVTKKNVLTKVEEKLLVVIFRIHLVA